MSSQIIIPNIVDEKAHRLNYAALIAVVVLLLVVCGALYRELEELRSEVRIERCQPR